MLATAIFLSCILASLLARRWEIERQEKEIDDLRRALGQTLAHLISATMKIEVGYGGRIFATQGVVNGKIVDHEKYRHVEIRWMVEKLDYSFSFGNEYESKSIAPREIILLLNAIKKLDPSVRARKS
ncbi:MAG: hypothetical protein Q8P23_01245 [bacterium]|nr:hypothetical protein [bacterium]